MGWWMVFWMVLFWGVIVSLVVWAVKRLTERGSSEKRDPLDIAKERYARGEISKEEFEQIKKDLS